MSDRASSVAAAMADTSALHDFDGKPVLGTGIVVTNAGDGLSQAMKVEPKELHQGDEVFIVIRGIVQKVRFEPIDKDEPAGAQRRVHVVKGGTATLVDGDLVKSHLDEQAARIREANERAQGIVPFPNVGTVAVPDAGEKPKRQRKAKAIDEATGDSGKKSKPSAPTGGPVDEDGFHDPAHVGDTAKGIVAGLPKPKSVPDLPADGEPEAQL